MKNNFRMLLITTAFGFSVLSAPAQAQMYISGQLGLGMLETSDVEDEESPGETAEIGFDSGIIFAGAVGFVMNSFRSELELSYQKNDIDTFGAGGVEIDAGQVDGFDGDFSSLTGLINGYYDFDTGTSFRPYLTAGLGLSKVDIEISIDDETFGTISESTDDTVIAYHLGAGVGYAISEKVIIDLRYRYFMTDDPQFDTASAGYTSHNVTAGVRVNF